MPCRSSSTVPSAAHSKTSRRHRSADDRLAVSFSTSRNSPEFSDDDEVDDEVEDDTDDDPDVSRLHQQAGKLPCGHKPYANSAGIWSHYHIASFFPCLKDMYRRVYKKKDVEQLLERANRSSTRRRSIAIEGPHSLSDKDTSSASADNDNEDEDEDEDDKAEMESKSVAKRQNRDQVALMVHHRLIEAAKKKLKDYDYAGYLYILRSREKPGLLKLGYSNRHVSNLGRVHTCTREFTWVGPRNQVAHIRKTEELARLDLDYLRRDWWCSKCSCTHKQWFEVDEERAIEVTKRWTTWINEQAPYGEDGKLRPVWAWLIDVRRVPRVLFGQDDHLVRWTKWKHILSQSSSQAEIAWAKYSNQAGLEAPIQHRTAKN
jgi:hypothetical protein